MSTPNEQGHPSDPWARPDERYITRPRWDDAEARVPTGRASLRLAQLCRHMSKGDAHD
jgi:hypothetical protein